MWTSASPESPSLCPHFNQLASPIFDNVICGRVTTPNLASWTSFVLLGEQLHCKQIVDVLQGLMTRCKLNDHFAVNITIDKSYVEQNIDISHYKTVTDLLQ